MPVKCAPLQYRWNGAKQQSYQHVNNKDCGSGSSVPKKHASSALQIGSKKGMVCKAGTGAVTTHQQTSTWKPPDPAALQDTYTRTQTRFQVLDVLKLLPQPHPLAGSPWRIVASGIPWKYLHGSWLLTHQAASHLQQYLPPAERWIN